MLRPPTVARSLQYKRTSDNGQRTVKETAVVRPALSPLSPTLSRSFSFQSQRGRAGKVSAARRAWAQFGVQKSRGSGGGVQGELFEVLLVDEVGLHLPLALNLHQPTRLQLDEGSCATCNASSVDQTAKLMQPLSSTSVNPN